MQGEGGHLSIGFWRPPDATGATLGGCWCPAAGVGGGFGLTTSFFPYEALGHCVALRRGATGSYVGAHRGAAQGRSRQLRWGAARAHRGAAQERGVGLRRRAVQDYVGAQCEAAQGP